jgi:hypothetical protein
MCVSRVQFGKTAYDMAVSMERRVSSSFARY